ncbi:MAG: hypothetical protein IKH26_06455, partial [Bacteroidaceae bacterium]|nr:hypothetical protein [Bacteroidaceae bacterium]
MKKKNSKKTLLFVEFCLFLWNNRVTKIKNHYNHYYSLTKKERTLKSTKRRECKRHDPDGLTPKTGRINRLALGT